MTEPNQANFSPWQIRYTQENLQTEDDKQKDDEEYAEDLEGLQYDFFEIFQEK